MGSTVDPDALIDDLPVGLQQRVEILKALYRGAEMLILDEPTGVLTPAEADASVHACCASSSDQGKTVILITHKLKEIMAVTDTRLGHAPRRDGGDASRRGDVASRSSPS